MSQHPAAFGCIQPIEGLAPFLMHRAPAIMTGDRGSNPRFAAAKAGSWSPIRAPGRRPRNARFASPGQTLAHPVGCGQGFLYPSRGRRRLVPSRLPLQFAPRCARSSIAVRVRRCRTISAVLTGRRCLAPAPRRAQMPPRRNASDRAPGTLGSRLAGPWFSQGRPPRQNAAGPERGLGEDRCPHAGCMAGSRGGAPWMS